MAARALLVTVAVLVSLAAAGPTLASDPARAFLASAFTLTRTDIGRLDAGQVISRTLAVKHKREVATLGIVRIKTTPEFYVERLTDIATFKRSEAVLQIGTFSSPPRLDDVASLTLEDDDVQSLRECRVGDCDIRLSAGAIERLRTDVDWEMPDAERTAADLMRHTLVDYVARYLEAGSSAAMEYADTPERLNLASEFLSLVAADTTTWPHVPWLRQHLLEFPVTHDDGAVDLAYWSKERVNGRPVISVTHLAIMRGVEDSSVDYAIGSRQIYAMHYFDASLGITLLVRDRGASPPATFVVYVNRSRIDVFDGVLGGIARRIVAGKARSVVAEHLGQLRHTLERVQPAKLSSKNDPRPHFSAQR